VTDIEKASELREPLRNETILSFGGKTLKCNGHPVREYSINRMEEALALLLKLYKFINKMIWSALKCEL